MRWLFVLVIGVLIGGAVVAVLRPDPTSDEVFTREAVWRIDDETAQELFECGTNTGGKGGETECSLGVMEAGGASEEAQSFFRETHWFLTAFRESGVVDIGGVVVPWRANANDDYLLVNGSPSFVTVEREAPPVALFGQDPAYEPLREAVNRTDDIPDEDDLVLWETDEVFEAVRRGDGKLRFVFQWSLKDACHACDTGYSARVALEFARDGTYLNAEPLNICFAREPGRDVERVEAEAPVCPATTPLGDASS
ncbi:MAG: hypothetical protein ACRDKJ_05785 [Actinomycetota bacterium]